MALGSWYLKFLNNFFENNIVLTIAAYNAGPVAIRRWIQEKPNLATDEFAENIPTHKHITMLRKLCFLWILIIISIQNPMEVTHFFTP